AGRSRFADADEDPGGERDRELTGGLERGETALRRLVRRTTVALEVRIQRLEHHPLRRRDRAKRSELVGEESPGVGMRQQARLLDDQPAHGGEVLDGARVAVV